MRTRLLSALALLWGAEVACAQMAPTYPANGYYQGNGTGYQTAPGTGAYPNNGYYPNSRPAGYGPYYPGYANYPRGYYPNYPGYPGYPNAYPTGYPRASLPAAPGMAVPPAALPAAPVNSPPPGMVVDRPVPYSDPMASAEADAWEGKRRFWVSADYAMSWIRPERLTAPLVTVGSPADAIPGALGQPGTVVVFGNNNIDFGRFNGVRAEVGVFLDSDNHFSLDAAGEFAFENHVKFAKFSDPAGNPIIGRPFFNVANVPPEEAIAQVSNAALGFAGGTSVDAKSEFFGAELNGRYHICCGQHLHLDALLGFRWLHLQESLTMQDLIVPTFGFLQFPLPQPQFVTAPNFVSDTDSFRTNNNFYGLQVGVDASWESDWWYVDGFANLALGGNDQSVNIDGSTTLFTPTGNLVAPGGILALPTNIGNDSRTRFAAIPEFGLTFGVHVLPHVWLTAGYTLLLWNEVLRPGSQIDHQVNATLIPLNQGPFAVPVTASPNHPQFSFAEDFFWIQSLNVGVNIRY
jgi:hypothetical protein